MLWYAVGLRSLGPVWSRPNRFAHGVPFMSPSSPDTGPGLTPAGRELVNRCAELGILVDLSHLNEAGFWDVARLEAGPLVASHAARSRAVRHLAQPHRHAAGRDRSHRGPGRDRVCCPLPAPGLRRGPRHPGRADRPARRLRRRADRGRPRGAGFGLRRCPDPGGRRRRCRGSRVCSTPSATPASATPRSIRSPGPTGAACSTPGGTEPGAQVRRRRRRRDPAETRLSTSSSQRWVRSRR